MTLSDESSGAQRCRLYAISPPALEPQAFATTLRSAFSGGDIAAFQLRLKDAYDETILEAAQMLIPICREHSAAFILNDRPDLALALKADGVHLGQDDLQAWQVGSIRKQADADFIIGISCHNSRHLAMEAGEAGADYVAFGAFYPTTSKDAEKLARYGTPTPDILSWWSENTVLPSVAIGGMTPENCGTIAASGADFIAAINGIWHHPQGCEVAVRQFNEALAQSSMAGSAPH